MINITICDGLIIPSRDHTPNISFLEASNDIKLIENMILMETTTFDNAKKIIKDLIDKVIGFIKWVINKVRIYIEPKKKHIKNNKKAILEFNESHPAYYEKVNVPENLLNPKYKISDINNKINDFLELSNKLLNREPDSEDHITSADMVVNGIFMDIIGKHPVNLSKDTIITAIYGESTTIELGKLNKTKVIDASNRITDDLDELQGMKERIGHSLTRLQMLFNNTTVIDPEIKTEMVYIYNGIIKAINIYISVELHTYTIIFNILNKMISSDNSTENNKN